jgi:predicted AAA+ superfamily ATPase
VGVFRTLRPAGPLDTPEEAEGPAVETLVLQNLIAISDGLGLGYKVHYWRTSDGTEVDFVLYGNRGCLAIEVKRGRRVSRADVAGLQSFLRDYPMARAILIYGGERRLNVSGVDTRPLGDFLKRLPDILQDGG